MISLSFSEFYGTNWADEGYELYIVKDLTGSDMYIGISGRSIWERWFGGTTSHMEPLPNGSLAGISYIGEAIARRFPESWNWRVELWTLEDCVNSLLDAGTQSIFGRSVHNLGIKDFEAYFIKVRNPYYNVMHAGGANQDPLLKKRLDKAYGRIFNSHEDDEN